jgi:hypothetical protein
MALISNRSDSLSELDLLSLVSQELQGRTTSPGESDLTKAMLRTGHAVLAQSAGSAAPSAERDSSEVEAAPPAVPKRRTHRPKNLVTSRSIADLALRDVAGRLRGHKHGVRSQN